MNCLEAQSKIVAFIEDKLEDSEKLDFIRHIRSCENCAEELEIYYTLLVGMKQLDEDIIQTTSFKQQMEDKLNAEYKHVQNRRKLTGSTIMVVLAAIFTVGFFAYESYRTNLYQQEQLAIKERQSEYYYYDYFGKELFHTEDYQPFDFADYIDHSKREDNSSYYERMQDYLNHHSEGDKEREEITID